MNRNTKIVLALLLVCAIAVGVIGYLASVRRAAQTATATATVVKAEREQKRGDDDTVLTLRFTAAGRTVEGRGRVDGVVMDAYPAGRQVPICYDPAKPDSLRVANGPCG